MTNDAKRRLAESAARRLEAAASALRGRGQPTKRVNDVDGGKTLVLGGVRSGKSRYAEELAGRYPAVTYIAAGMPPSDDDPEWSARVAAHRARRPSHWTTVETGDVTAALRDADSPVLIDCLGTWLTRVLDESGAWEQRDGWQQRVDERLGAFADAWRQAAVPAIAVSNEVGSGVVPASASGRIFRDVLGALNTAVATHSDAVRLIVAGRVLTLE
ncbi:adenosylcobinamide kinase/adenosylcobinamide-phosphate guanylyltransferase [Prauserella isguenensis]|uniref:Adenosylcobinamide kinase n=1 Tax=Prauserella isguenensis TaxID=1470180 RepID=A0A839S478_9PSEU|nr:bifunctional adenosylcobinamide kinase/adenosylcobinamide-phosphate guanylyltransferase [Prauserella isguenensis]MBB3052182.1 adenosylcobinamide kinase/adenosylcobinamide-phosphate guanylyltransferase [Prauserella isguenensis]